MGWSPQLLSKCHSQGFPRMKERSKVTVGCLNGGPWQVGVLLQVQHLNRVQHKISQEIKPTNIWDHLHGAKNRSDSRFMHAESIIRVLFAYTINEQNLSP